MEQLSRDLFRKLLDAPTCDRLGSNKGKAQFGLDLLAQSGQRTYGIQCKCYTTTKLTVATIQSHVD
ncbi:MAG: hypothetical protein K8F30_06330, partial [Taibaiella sp.]|nr:hypothetical protein [Taibaiella sp.]